jgi:putative transposase
MPRCSIVTETRPDVVSTRLFTLIDMAHTYTVILVHCVFSTKNRRKLIPDELQSKLWSFVGGIARKNGFKAILGGTEDHMHALLSLPATIPLAKAVQLLKGASSHWMNETAKNRFGWQEGYGAFTIGISQKAGTVAYIQAQRERHHRRDFQQEFVAFLKKHGVEYDPDYVWG